MVKIFFQITYKNLYNVLKKQQKAFKKQAKADSKREKKFFLNLFESPHLECILKWTAFSL